jgi:catechol 2,3-dioxygenase
MMPGMATSERISDAMSLGPVELTVGDLDDMAAFYETAIGLSPLARDGAEASLGSDSGAPLLRLAGDPDAPTRPRHSTGLFHVAFLVPSRRELARSVRRVLDAGWSFTGASDHLVSEALYLDDPEGNGIEIYRDRPRDEWPYENGELQMATLPLDLDAVMRELEGDETHQNARSEGPRIGHVHLQVADTGDAGSFYAGALGLDYTARRYPGAIFLSAGGYHHHIGANTWASAGAPPPPPGSRGLRRYTIVLPDNAELDRVSARLSNAGFAVEAGDDGVDTVDPSGNRARLTTAGASE